MTNHAIRTRLLLVSALLPLLLVGVFGVVAASWLPDLPRTVAVHWTVDGPDGFASPWLAILLPAVITVLFVVITVAAAWRPAESGHPTVTQKILLATAPALAALLVVGLGGSLWGQRGLTDPAAAPSVLPWLGIGLAVGVVVFIAAWFVLPPGDRTPLRGAPAEPLPIPSTSAAYWSRTVALEPAMWVLIGTIAAVVVGLTVFVPQSAVIGLIVLVLMLAAALLTGAWRVTADRRGLTVRGILGVPVVRVAADDIAQVRLVEVHPTADFGGWGVRQAPGGRFGIVLKAGQAIEVVRRNGRSVTVTVDDAATGAGVLAALTGALR